MIWLHFRAHTSNSIFQTTIQKSDTCIPWISFYLKLCIRMSLCPWYGVQLQGSFWPSENWAKTDTSKVNRCHTSSQECLPEPPSIQAKSFLTWFTLISGMTKFWSKLAKIGQLAAQNDSWVGDPCFLQMLQYYDKNTYFICGSMTEALHWNGSLSPWKTTWFVLGVNSNRGSSTGQSENRKKYKHEMMNVHVPVSW